MKDPLEELLQAIHGAVGGDIWGKRFAVAAKADYYDAKHMVYLMDTFGMAPVDYVLESHKRGHFLKVPWLGLRSEMLRIGKRASSINASLSEMRSMMCLVEGRPA